MRHSWPTCAGTKALALQVLFDCVLRRVHPATTRSKWTCVYVPRTAPLPARVRDCQKAADADGWSFCIG